MNTMAALHGTLFNIGVHSNIVHNHTRYQANGETLATIGGKVWIHTVDMRVTHKAIDIWYIEWRSYTS